MRKFVKLNRIALAIYIAFYINVAMAYCQTNSPINHTVIKINTNEVIANVSPTLYGIMTEEINHSYDGGLYAELIQNRIFKDDGDKPVHWSVIEQTHGSAKIGLDSTEPINDSLTVCLKLNAENATTNNRVGFANDGFWGIPVKPLAIYKVSFFAKTSKSFAGSLTVSLEDSTGKILAQSEVIGVINTWQKYSLNLTTGAAVKASSNNKFVISTTSPGTLWFNQVSLFPPTYNNRLNGNRIDIMQKLADLHPTFLRCPGGNYVEGNSMAHYYDWKKTIHDLSVRPGHPGTWKYRSSDGLGILEYMEWCEDLHIQPVLAIFAGYTLNKEYIAAGPALKKYVDDALDEIEYITGSVNTTWGAQRAADGHPKPFTLNYIEVGNEDFFDKSGSYDGRFTQFYDAIKAKYPKLQLIATTAVKGRTPDIYDDHFYKYPQVFENDTHHYDPEKHDRKGPKIFVGEWASRTGKSMATPDMNCALGDAAWMTGMERNSDLVIMASYAPLFVNVNPGAMQWRINMIGYNALNSYGSPSYYAQQMFYQNLGNVVVSSHIDSVAPVPFIAPPSKNSVAPAEPQFMPSISYSVTKDTQTGILYLKVVNIMNQAQNIRVELSGIKSIEPTGIAITLSGRPDDTNTINDPEKVIPVNTVINELSTTFNYQFLANSVTILKLQTQQ